MSNGSCGTRALITSCALMLTTAPLARSTACTVGVRRALEGRSALAGTAARNASNAGAVRTTWAPPGTPSAGRLSHWTQLVGGAEVGLHFRRLLGQVGQCLEQPRVLL